MVMLNRIRVRHLLLTLTIALIATLIARYMSYSSILHGNARQTFFRYLTTTFRSIVTTPTIIMATSPTEATRPVIIVGSGLAGLAAAHEALRAGAAVVMLEQAAKPGGNSIKASSGINGAGTRFQKASGITNDSADLFRSDTIRSAGSRLQTRKEGGIDRASLVHALATHSASAIHWLADEIDVELPVVAALGGHSVARTHRGAGKVPPGAAIVSGLLQKLVRFPGFALHTSARVAQLHVDDKGNVRGVRYVRKSENGQNKPPGPPREREQKGEQIDVYGPVVFTAGGFAGDALGLLARYRPDLAGLPSTNEARPGPHGLLTNTRRSTTSGSSSSSGMAGVGAELVDMDSVQVHPTGFVDPRDANSPYKILAAEMLRGEGGILLSPQGRRFVNELERRDVVSEAIMALPPPVDDEEEEENGNRDPRQWDVALLLDPGAMDATAAHLSFYLFKGLVEKKKVKDLDPAVIEAVDRYAESVASGRGDDEFGRRTFGRWRLMPGEANREEEVCIGRVTPVVHFTMGGVAFDNKARVLRRAGEEGGALVPVPGLWAAGEITGGLHGDNRLGGSSLLECVVFGRVAGREAAEAAK
ncbi:Flavocytochrome c [Sodiomyces alkalinus F11]|uniref:Flavocytochrome c n=1 Tax=Sodiomyces alkalinus (strain CBS 110278 / VKM F-3762 / F11) TaxID=1314773 RepID=A0A3N2PZJ1_SODAK|nr:Flavocytochrome c [Sodiomyces alkalinus F11]ROT39940.1 Flavocytochrome c [Sodiomyces alkalinus F11]